jgi:hypothetical protein
MSTFNIFAGHILQVSENIIQSKSQVSASHFITKSLIKTKLWNTICNAEPFWNYIVDWALTNI